MSLLERIRSDWMAARRGHDGVISNLLGTVIGKCETEAKSGSKEHDLTDEDVIRIVQGMRNAIMETINLLKERPGRVDDLATWERELEQITSYLPEQLSEQELTQIAVGQHSLGQNLGQIMAHLKSNHFGRYDARQASIIVKGVVAA
jgi:uncharacterized protein YqeY